jgi:leader peptidase (prepilin peptidase)/N-methyltransferase
LNFSYQWLIVSFLVIVFVYDLKHYLIPDEVIYPALGIGLLYQLFRIWDYGKWNFGDIWNLGFGILPALFFLAIILISREKLMGWGDFKLAILMGLFLGWPKILIALFFSFFLGAIIGIGLVLAKKKNFKSEIPFGPFLVFGTFLALFFGQGIINWYLNFF